MGEALSTVCEGLLHPEGYYPPPINGPRITIWLNSTTSLINWQRPNWIDRTENSDRNYVSFGCGIAFIYYLMWRGYSIQQISANGGQTFEPVYQNLTKSTGGWGAFASLLDLHFPEFPHPRYAPTSDNLFPLPQLAGVSLQPTTVVAGLPARRHAHWRATGQLSQSGRVAVQTSAPSSMTATDHRAARPAAAGSSDSASRTSAAEVLRGGSSSPRVRRARTRRTLVSRTAWRCPNAKLATAAAV